MSKLAIYNDIKTALEAIKVANNPVIEHIGLWNDQFDNEEREFAFNFPALFIEFGTIRWDISSQKPPRAGATGNVQKEQKGDKDEPSIITLHIGFWQLEDPDASFEIIAPIIDKVYFALQFLTGDFYQPLLRIEERQDVDHEGVIDWQMDFQTTLQQAGEADSSLTEIAADDLTLAITKDLDIEPDSTTGVRTGPE